MHRVPPGDVLAVVDLQTGRCGLLRKDAVARRRRAVIEAEHLEQVAAILKDPEASANDRYVALTLLKNAEIAAEGILTARGGVSSHAALVARQMGKVCVCGAAGVAIAMARLAATSL